MKKILLKGCIGVFVLALGFAFAGCDNGNSSQEPSLEYKLVEDGYSVVGIGTYEEGILNIPSTYKGKPVTTIGEGAFTYEAEIGIVNIPDSVTTIEKKAFYQCPNLTQVSIGKNVTVIEDSAFANCTNITEITDWDSVATIGVEAFKACVMLKEIEFPDSLKTISDSAFEECVRLKDVRFGTQLERIGKNAFYGCKMIDGVEIPDGAPTEIMDQAFYGCEAVEYIRLGNSVKRIGASAFESCAMTREIVIGDGVIVIGGLAFSGCRKVYQITLGSSLFSIGNSAFEKCWLLREIYNRSNIALTLGSEGNGGVAYYAFYVRKGDQPTRISKDENNELIYYTEGSKKMLIGVDLAKSGPLVVPDDVTEIAPYACYNEQEITSVYIGDGCKKIGESAFRNTYQIRELTLGKNVEEVANYAFRYNGYITSPVIGKKLKKVGKEAFLKKVGDSHYRPYATVYYEGTQAEWGEIEFAEGNADLLAKSVSVAYYSADKPTSSGLYWQYVGGKPAFWN